MSASDPLKPEIKIVDGPVAPIIFFDSTPTMAHFNGIVALTLSAVLWAPTSDGNLEAETALVAHLRTNIQGAKSLRDAIDKALLLAAPAGGGDAKN